MPKQTLPPPTPGDYNIDLIAGSELNTLVMAIVRVLRGKVTRSELLGAAPHSSYAAVGNAIQRLIDYGILDTGGSGVYFTPAPWLPELEQLYDAYIRLRPELRSNIQERLKVTRQRSADRPEQTLFGYAVEERTLQALAVNGPMKRSELASEMTVARPDTLFEPLIKAGILTAEEQTGVGGKGAKPRGAWKRVVISLNADFPVYRELRALLLTLAQKPAKNVRDLSSGPPQDGFDPEVIFNTPATLKALLLTNAVRERELDAASLKRLRLEHPLQVIHNRLHWFLQEGIVDVRKSGHMLYYSLNPDYRAHKPLKQLLERIGKVWPELVESAAMNDELKDKRRKTEDRNARRRQRLSGAPRATLAVAGHRAAELERRRNDGKNGLT